MSGICGFIDISKKFNKEDMLNAITAMNSALYASNDGYIYQDDDCIIGKSDNYADNDSFIVFFYGELYNKQSLCKIYDFTANNEAQLVLAGYEKFGDDFFKQLSGKFVFVIYDKKTKKLTVIRDKVGSKQMYYYKNEDCFVFCTELAGLLATNIVPKKIDKVSLSQFLQLTYIPAPQCIIENVKKVKPAVVFCLDSYANIFENDYWTLTHSIDEKYTDFEVCKAELNDLLYASVKEKMALYPDSGAFLSGGFDSSIVVSVMSDISDTPIRTFTIGYDEKQFDESELAGLVAKKNNTNHTVLNLDWDAVVDNIDTVLNGVDEPYGDSSLIATYAVCKLAKEHTDVAFMGDAGDELFAGYNKYLISYYGSKYKKIPKFLRKGIIEPISKLLPRKSSLYRKVNKVISSADMPIFEQRKRLMSLGFKAEEVLTITKDAYKEEILGIKALVEEYGEKYGQKIPVVVAGGVSDAEKIADVMALGVDGVQVASRFVTTYECDASQAFKDAYLNAKEEDIMIVKSPVGMPGRAIRNKFMEETAKGSRPITKCYQCIKGCQAKDIPYCITKALVNSVRGNVDEGLVFCGANAWQQNKMQSVKEVVEELFPEA